MTPRLTKLTTRFSRTGAALILLLSTRSAVAQTPGRVVDPEGSMVVWLVAVGLILLVCLTGFLSAKRSHLN